MTARGTDGSGSMRVWVSGDGVALARSERPVPEMTGDGVMVRVHAAALNNGDLHPSGEEHVAGFEFSGEVLRVGDHADISLLGKRVCGIAEGTLADYVVADRRHLLLAPTNLSDAEAAATPTAFTTELGAAWTAGIGSGSSVLVTAGSSSLGLVAIQVARELGAARVIATTRTGGKAAAMRDAGADSVLVAENERLAEVVLDATDGRGVDFVLDHLGGDALDSVIASTADGGTVVSVGRLAGGRGSVDLFALARRHVQLRSVSYGLTPPEVLGTLFDGFDQVLLSGVLAGRVRPIVGASFAFDDADQALETLRAGSTVGKIVVMVR